MKNPKEIEIIKSNINKLIKEIKDLDERFRELVSMVGTMNHNIGVLESRVRFQKSGMETEKVADFLKDFSINERKLKDIKGGKDGKN